MALDKNIVIRRLTEKCPSWADFRAFLRRIPLRSRLIFVGTIVVSSGLTVVLWGPSSDEPVIGDGASASSVVEQGPYGALSCGESASYYFRHEATLNSPEIEPRFFAALDSSNQHSLLSPSMQTLSAEVGLLMQGHSVEGRVLQRPLLLTPERRLYAFEYVLGSSGLKGTVYAIFGRNGSIQAIFRGVRSDDDAVNMIKKLLGTLQVAPEVTSLAWKSAKAKGGKSIEGQETGPGGTASVQYTRGAMTAGIPTGALHRVKTGYVSSTSWLGEPLVRDSGWLPGLDEAASDLQLSRSGLLLSFVEETRFLIPVMEKESDLRVRPLLTASSRFEVMRLHQDSSVDHAGKGRMSCTAARVLDNDAFAKVLEKSGVQSTPFHYEWSEESRETMVNDLRSVLVSGADSTKLADAVEMESAAKKHKGRLDEAGPLAMLAVELVAGRVDAAQLFASRLRKAVSEGPMRDVVLWSRILGASRGREGQTMLLAEVSVRPRGEAAEAMTKSLMLVPQPQVATIEALMTLWSHTAASSDVRRAALIAAGACGSRVKEPAYRTLLATRIAQVVPSRRGDGRAVDAMFEALGRLGEKASLVQFKNALADESPDGHSIGLSAINALAYMPGEDVDRLLLDVYTSDRDSGFRLAAVKALSKRKVEEPVLADLVKSFEAGVKRDNADIRLAVLEVLMSKRHEVRDSVSGFLRAVDKGLKLSSPEHNRIADGPKAPPAFAGRSLL